MLNSTGDSKYNAGSLLTASGAVSNTLSPLEAAYSYHFILVSKHNIFLTVVIVCSLLDFFPGVSNVH